MDMLPENIRGLLGFSAPIPKGLLPEQVPLPGRKPVYQNDIMTEQQDLSNFILSDKDRNVFAMIESSGNSSAVNKNSGATGLYQFKFDTAKELMPSIERKDLFNPDVQNELLDRYVQRNVRSLGSVDPFEIYMAHQQGVSGFKEISRFKDRPIKNMRNPDRKKAVKANMLPKTKKRKNPTIGDFLNDWKERYYELRSQQ